MVSNVFLIIICFLPFAHLLSFATTKVDIWHAQGYFLQLGILVLYFLHLFKRSRPLSLLLLWAGLSTFYYWIYFHITLNQYPTFVFLPFFNFLCLVILYDLIIHYLNKDIFLKLIKYLSFSVGLILIYCVLQKLNLDQFYKSLNPAVEKDTVVGTIGNSMHLSHYLAIALPLFLIYKGEIRKLLILFCLFAIFLTGSISGLFIALIVLIFYSFFERVFTLKEIALLGLLAVLVFVFKFHNLKNILENLSSSGRIDIWKKYYLVFKERPITGWGLGVVNGLAQKKEFLGWRHLHLEIYHFAVELGLISVGLIIWGIIDYFKRLQKDKAGLIMASVFLGFLIASCFGYPCHIWLMASLGIISYSYNYLEER